jgi:DNA-binding NarL/FixJ family response regulator
MYKVIVVDDEQNIRSGLRRILDWEAHGFEVCAEASDGEEGLLLAEKHRPDLAIVDIKMPGMGGIDMIRELKHRESACKTIILSGYSDFAYAQSALEFGAGYYLLKPIDRAELSGKIGAIRETLDREYRERALLEASLRLSRDGILESLISGDGDMELISSANSRFCFDFPWSSYQVVLVSPQSQETMAEARRCCSQVTTGPATVARIAPTTTGSTMVEVRPRSHTSPTRTIPTPTRNHASRPRSRSQIGAEKTRESDDASIWTTVAPSTAGWGALERPRDLWSQGSFTRCAHSRRTRSCCVLRAPPGSCPAQAW